MITMIFATCIVNGYQVSLMAGFILLQFQAPYYRMYNPSFMENGTKIHLISRVCKIISPYQHYKVCRRNRSSKKGNQLPLFEIYKFQLLMAQFLNDKQYLLFQNNIFLYSKIISYNFLEFIARVHISKLCNCIFIFITTH